MISVGPATLLSLTLAAWCLSLGCATGWRVCCRRLWKRLLGLGLWPGKQHTIPLQVFSSRTKLLCHLENIYWGEELRKRKRPTGQLIPSFKVIFTEIFVPLILSCKGRNRIFYCSFPTLFPRLRSNSKLSSKQSNLLSC